jgi:hypothetical protein
MNPRVHLTFFIEQLTLVGTIYYEQIAYLGDQFEIFYTLRISLVQL